MVGKTPKSPKKTIQSSALPIRRGFASHAELLADMDRFRQETLATPGAARQFLIDAGLISKAGKPMQLIRD